MRLVPLTPHGFYARVDEEDFALVSSFRWNATGMSRGGTIYALAYETRSTRVAMHRLILQPSPGVEVDHIDGDGLNNTRRNLRAATRAQNSMAKGITRANTSGFKGVYRRGQDRWIAAIKVSGRGFHLGVFSCPRAAALAYDRAAREHFGQFAYLNFRDEEHCNAPRP